MSVSEPPPNRHTVFVRYGIAVLAMALCGGTIYVRVHHLAAGGSGMERAISALQRAGAEIQDRDLPPELLSTLEPHPGLGPVDGKTLLAQTVDQKKVVLLNFWATWCPPCIDELASLRELAQRLERLDTSVVAVSYDDDWASQKSALQRHLGSPMPPPILWARDPQGQEGDESQMMRIRFGTRKLPETYVIVSGRILARFVGEQRWSDPAIATALTLTAEAVR